MPSGAKKRKAAKKKMVKAPNNSSSIHSHVLANDQTMEGDDEPKQETPFTEGGVEKLESRSTVRSIVSESSPQEEVNHDGVMDEGFVQIDREMNSVEDSKGKTVSTDNEKESNDSSSSGSSSSNSSDDESRVLGTVIRAPRVVFESEEELTQESVETEAISAVEVNHSVEETVNFVDLDKNVDDAVNMVILDYPIESDDSSSDDEKEKAVVETAPLGDSNKITDSFTAAVIQVSDAIPAGDVNHSVEEFGSTVEADKVEIFENNHANESDNDLEERKVEVEGETSPLVDSNKLINSLSKVITQVSDLIPSEEFNHLVDEAGSDKIVIVEHEKEPQVGSSPVKSSSKSLNDESHVLDEKTAVDKTAPPVDSVKFVDSLPKVGTQVSDAISAGDLNHSVDNSMTSCSVDESGLKENGEKKFLSLDGSAESPSILTNLGSQKKENEMVSSFNKYAKNSAVLLNEDENSLSNIAPKIGTSNGEERVKSENCECSDSQPLVASAPRTVQTTSWKSCCGIFELFTGTNR
ncbi:hypothetical protein LguiA_014844 [Lonicera macranthoides]